MDKPVKVSGIMQVVMAHWIDPEPHDWPQYASRLRQLWHNPKWCRSIFVDDAPVPGVTHTRNLHSRLQHIAARACGVCDPQGHRPFPSNTALTKHVTAQHHQHMCTVCLDVSPNLPARTLMLLQAELWATALHGSLPVLLAWTGKVFFVCLDLHSTSATCVSATFAAVVAVADKKLHDQTSTLQPCFNYYS